MAALSRSGHPDHSTPAIMRREVPRRIASQSQTRHDRLRSRVVHCRVGQDLSQSCATKGVIQGRQGGLRGVSLSPGPPHEAPANLDMRTERMSLRFRHHPGVAEQLAVQRRDGPAGKAVPGKCRTVSVELGIARRTIDRPAQVGHHLRVAVQRGKPGAIVFLPGPQPQTRSLDPQCSKMSISGQPARSSRARVGRKRKAASASSVRPSRASRASSLALSACRWSTSEAA